ncbi:ribokinase [Mycobacterium sp. LTG2003]
MRDRRVFVVGSLNADHRVRVARIPSAGETVIGGDVAVSPGGKGANQAVAAARAGASVTLVGAVGADRDGELLLARLAADDVDTSHIRVVPHASTGRAMVTVDDDGENSIVVSPGANSRLTIGDVDTGLRTMTAGDLLLLQLETPMALATHSARRAAEAGGTVVINAAPVPPSLDDLLSHVDLLVVNGHELSGIATLLDGRPARTGLTDDMAVLACASGATVVCTAGSDGAYVKRSDGVAHVEARRVKAVDTTAAGDTFIGYLAARLAADPGDVTGALRYAVHAAGLAVTRPGAMDSIPHFSEITITTT